MRKGYIIGIDGGATYIRVAVADYDGNILSHIKYQGGAAIQKNDNPQENMRNAIVLALKQANVCPEDVIAIGAGISGYDDDEDLVWVNTLIDIKGLNCPVKYVNDAEVAHIGAFNEKSGVIAICGTGSIVFGMDEFGTKIRNYDFGDYAYSASRHLTQNLINRIVKCDNDFTNDNLVSKLLEHFEIKYVEDLHSFASDKNELNRGSNPKQYGEFAKVITEYALNGNILAQKVCNDAADEVCRSIVLVSKRFDKPISDVALIGSVVNSKYIFDYIKTQLYLKGYDVKCNVLLPEIGAVVLALKTLGVVASESVLNNLALYIENN